VLPCTLDPAIKDPSAIIILPLNTLVVETLFIVIGVAAIASA